MADSGPGRLSARGLGTLSVGGLAGLWAVLVSGLILRTVGIGWGLPPTTAEVAASGFRGSYALGEDEILGHLAQTDPSAFKFDPVIYRWGTLHLEVMLAGLEVAQKLNFFESPWREAYQQMQPGGFERVYAAARLVSGIMDLATVFLVFILGREIAGTAAGIWSSAIIAAAPGHVLVASQIRADSTATTLLMLAMLLGVRLAKSDSARLAAWMGLAAGLAVTAKYSIAPMALAVCIASLWPHRKNSRGWMLTGGAVVAGFLLGEPFVLTNARKVLEHMELPAANAIGSLVLPVVQMANLARFSIGLPAALLGVLGLWQLARADSRFRWVLLAPLGAGILALIPQGGGLMRQHLPFVPLVALGAGYALCLLRRPVQWPSGFLALAFALAGSVAQIHFMLSPHPMNLALSVLRNSATAGDAVSRAVDGMPPLDESVYRSGPDPLKEALSANPPAWVVTSDLPVTGIPVSNRKFLRDHYKTIAIFRSERILGWASFGESGSPPDWRYTHPVTTLYRLQR